MEDRKILSYNGIVLGRSDLDILEGDCYLNDTVLGFYFSYLSSLFGSDEILLVPPSVSFLLANSEDTEIVNQSSESLKFADKQIIVFAINDIDGLHWSVLVYDRVSYSFFHHDTIEGANNLPAMDLFDKVKDFVGEAKSTAIRSKKKKTANNIKNKNKPVTKSTAATGTTAPTFCEANTPQQISNYDCGIYVMAITKEICQWHTSESKEKTWISAVEKNIFPGTFESTMRSELVKLIKDLSSTAVVVK